MTVPSVMRPTRSSHVRRSFSISSGPLGLRRNSRYAASNTPEPPQIAVYRRNEIMTCGRAMRATCLKQNKACGRIAEGLWSYQSESESGRDFPAGCGKITIFFPNQYELTL